MRVGFTGTQIGMSEQQKASLLSFLREHAVTQFHHGDCIGADAEAHELVKEEGIEIHIHPPLNSSKRAFKEGCKSFPHAEYLKRNHCIVDSTDLLIAAPKTDLEESRSGTWATVRYARKRGKTVIRLHR